MPDINIRGVSAEAHKRLRIRAAEASLSLNQYLVEELTALSELPTREQMVRRLAETRPLPLTKQPEEYVREMREAA